MEQRDVFFMGVNMASQTTYYNLTKPSGNDKVNIDVLNDNADIIDSALHNKADNNDIPSSANDISYGIGTVKDALDGLNTALAYSTTEHVVGKWIDGSTLYEKTIDFGALPNASTASKAHGINNLSTIVSIQGTASDSSYAYPLPYTAVEPVNNIQMYILEANIWIRSGTNRTGLHGYVTLRYTKTS